VTPDVVRLPLSDGDWVDVKKELNAGEQRRIFTGLVKTMQAGEKPELNPDQVGVTKLVEYILGWSFHDSAGNPVPFNAAALNNLDGDTYAELIKVIDAHDEAAEKARDERKNALSTPPISVAT
jgi:hypothetical protein